MIETGENLKLDGMSLIARLLKNRFALQTIGKNGWQ